MGKLEKRLGLRRDFEDERNRVIDETEQPRPVSRRKSTKRWCKGKVGREHVPELVKAPQSFLPDCRESKSFFSEGPMWFCVHLIRCSVCEKHLDEFPWCPDRPAGMAQFLKKE